MQSHNKTLRPTNKTQRANRDMLVYPLRGILGLLKAWRYNRELNVARALRELDWVTDTFESMTHNDLGGLYEEVQKLLNEVSDVVSEFNFSEAKNSEDDVTHAVEYWKQIGLM